MSKRRNVRTSKRPDAGALSHAPQSGDLDVWTIGRLDVSRPPDLTRRIMGRLGYMRVRAETARRDRVRKWAGRCGTLLIAALALGIGWRVYEGSDAVRRPSDITIPAAIGSDFQRQQDRIGEVIRTFRNLTAPGHNHSMPAIPFDGDDHDWDEYDVYEFDEEPATCSPFRWV